MIGHLSIDWVPHVPWPLLAALGGVAMALAAFALWRQAPGVWWVFAGTLAIYSFIGLATITVLRQLANVPLPEEEHGA